MLSSRLILVLSFASVYIIWGSTYLAIRYAIETLPTWGLAATRFLAAGAVMMVLARITKEPRLSRFEWKQAWITGSLLMLANAMICYVEKWIPSGIVAVCIGAMPIWMMLMGRFFLKQASPSTLKWIGASIGLLGVSVIAFSQAQDTLTGAGKYAIPVLLVSNLMWCLGSLLQRRVPKISSPFRYTGAQMLLGGFMVSVLSVGSGEPWAMDWNTVSRASIGAWIYLVVFGSIIAFTAYSWLARNVEPHLLSSYALVNPVIAVALGSLLASEPITSEFIIATLLVCVGLALLLFDRSSAHAKSAQSLPPLPTTEEVLRAKSIESTVPEDRKAVACDRA